MHEFPRCARACDCETRASGPRVTASRRDGRGKKEGGIMAASTAPVTVKETIQVRVAIE